MVKQLTLKSLKSLKKSCSAIYSMFYDFTYFLSLFKYRMSYDMFRKYCYCKKSDLWFRPYHALFKETPRFKLVNFRHFVNVNQIRTDEDVAKYFLHYLLEIYTIMSDNVRKLEDYDIESDKKIQELAYSIHDIMDDSYDLIYKYRDRDGLCTVVIAWIDNYNAHLYSEYGEDFGVYGMMDLEKYYFQNDIDVIEIEEGELKNYKWVGRL